jgi:hypothetical protein
MMTREDYKEGFTHFAETMIRMWKRGSDRDNTILLAMTHDNFPEYFETYKHMFIMGFSSLDNFLIALLRNYIMVQIASISHDAPNDKRHYVIDIFNEIITENLEKYKGILMTLHAPTYGQIVDLHNKQLRIH